MYAVPGVSPAFVTRTWLVIVLPAFGPKMKYEDVAGTFGSNVTGRSAKFAPEANAVGAAAAAPTRTAKATASRRLFRRLRVVRFGGRRRTVTGRWRRRA